MTWKCLLFVVDFEENRFGGFDKRMPLSMSVEPGVELPLYHPLIDSLSESVYRCVPLKVPLPALGLKGAIGLKLHEKEAHTDASTDDDSRDLLTGTSLARAWRRDVRPFAPCFPLLLAFLHQFRTFAFTPPHATRQTYRHQNTETTFSLQSHYIFVPLEDKWCSEHGIFEGLALFFVGRDSRGRKWSNGTRAHR
jgi:hypothetical protein